MDTVAEFSDTGRSIRGPASDLVEVTSSNGLRHTAIVFHPEFRSHRGINTDLDVVIGFLESPLVTGLSDLVARDESVGAFVYPTGQAWSISEVIRSLSDLGCRDGHIRGGLELMSIAGQILTEASDRGQRDGVYSHGGLTPRRVMLKRDGQVEIIGYALPQIEILQFHENENSVPGEDSFRYCPPERIDPQQQEMLYSDLFALSLIGFELMTGLPVYDGLVNDIRQKAARGECSRRIFKFREKLPDSVRMLFSRALRPNPEDRHESGQDFVRDVQRVLSSKDATGDSLMDLMAKVSVDGPRPGKKLQAGKTQMFTKDQLNEFLDPEDGDSTSAGRDPMEEMPSEMAFEPVAAAPLPEEAPPPPKTPKRRKEPKSEAGHGKWSKIDRPRRRAKSRSENQASGGGAGHTSEDGSSAQDLLSRIQVETSSSLEYMVPNKSTSDEGQESKQDKPKRPRRSARTPKVDRTLGRSTSGDHRDVPSTDPAQPPKETKRSDTSPSTDSGFDGGADWVGVSLTNRPTDSIALPSSKEGRVSLSFVKGRGGRRLRMGLPTKATTAEVVALLLGNVIPVRTDLTGRISCWYRLELEGERLDSRLRLEELDARKNHTLMCVLNTTIQADIEIVGTSTPTRFVAPVGTAVPMVTLVDHLAAWLNLPAGEWYLDLDGDRMGAYEILSDRSWSSELPRLRLIQAKDGE